MPNLGNRQMGKRNLGTRKPALGPHQMGKRNLGTRRPALGLHQMGKRNLLNGMSSWELNNTNYTQEPMEMSNGSMAYWHKNGTLHGRKRKSRKTRRRN